MGLIDWKFPLTATITIMLFLHMAKKGSAVGHGAVNISIVLGNGCGNTSVGDNACCTDGWAYDSTDEANFR